MFQWRRWLRVGLVMALAAGAWGAGAGRAGAAPAVPAPASSAPAFIFFPTAPPGCGELSPVPGTVTANKPIPDAVGAVPGVLTSTVTVTTSAIYVWDVVVTMAITHTFSGDLELTLISPHGTRVTLAKHNGTSLDDIYNNVTFNDQGGLTHPPGPVTLASFVNGAGVGLVNPQEPLSAFNGENPNGTWTLEVRDNVAAGKGVLKNWALFIDALTTTPTVVPSYPAINNQVSAIPDGSGQVDIPLTVDMVGAVAALTLTTVITHPSTRDLVLELITPTGVTLTVSNRNPLTNSVWANVFAGTTWTDKAGASNPPGPVTDNAYSSGTLETPLSPQEGFAEVNGEDENGTWHLRVRDVFNNSQAGTLGRVTLSATSLSCVPALTNGIGGHPDFARLGKPRVVDVYVLNLGAPASDVLQKISLLGPYGFQAATGPDWACTPLPVGTPSPTVDCVRGSLGQVTGFSNKIQVTVTAPLIPQEMAISVSVTASGQGLITPTYGIGAYVTSWASSGNGNPWDLLDGQNPHFGSPADSGSIRNGGQDTFFGFGQIHVRALNLTGTVLADNWAQNLGLTYSPGHRWQSLTGSTLGGVFVTRSILAPAGADWLRYVDTFHNQNAIPTQVVVSWGGTLASLSHTKLAATSNHNLTLETPDTWAVAFQQDVLNGPALRPPVGLVFRSGSDSTYQGPYLFSGGAITQTLWPSLGNGSPGQVFKFTLQPNETKKLAYFLARGLAEGTAGPADCGFYGGCVTPAAGSQVALMESTAAALGANPPFCDLTQAEVNQILNWPGVTRRCLFLPQLLK